MMEFLKCLGVFGITVVILWLLVLFVQKSKDIEGTIKKMEKALRVTFMATLYIMIIHVMRMFLW